MTNPTCPSCLNNYADILDHIRKKHPYDKYTTLQLQPLGLTPCPTCATACRGQHGVRVHQQKIHHITGLSKISTQPRLPSSQQPDIIKASHQPTQPTTPKLRTRKRAACTPTPEQRRPSQKQRTYSSSSDTSLPSLADLLSPSQELKPTIVQPEEEDIYNASSPIRYFIPPPTMEEICRPTQQAKPIQPRKITQPLQPRQTTQPAQPVQPSQPRQTTQPVQPVQPIHRTQEQATLEQAHHNALAPILDKPFVQSLIAFSKVYIPEKKLYARHANLFTTTAERLAQAFVQNPREKELFHFLILPRVLGLGLARGQLAQTLKNFPTILPDPEPEHRTDYTHQQQQEPVDRARKLLEKGFIGRASQALLNPSALLEETPDVLQTLYQKHPLGPSTPFDKANPRPGQVITTEAIQNAVRSIHKEKSPGLSGWTRPLLDIVTHNTNSPVLAMLRLLTDMIRQGTAPGQDLLCASRLLALEKPEGGVRPIAVGDLIYRVAYKAILTSTFQRDMLLPTQLGVNSPGGVEPIIFLLEEAIEGDNKQGYKNIASLDLSNAFNSISRRSISAAVANYAPTFYKAARWAYNQPSILLTSSGATLASSEGVRQGDPLAPLLFSLAIRPTLEHLQQLLPLATIIAYLDDIYILNKDNKPLVCTATQALKNSPVVLNPQKSMEESIQTVRQQGLKTLGTYIGPLNTRRKFLLGKLRSLSTALEKINTLPLQHLLLLLKGSVHLLLRHLLRQLNPENLQDLWEKADKVIHNLVAAVASRPGASQPYNLNKISTLLISIPAKEGGLGIPNHQDLAKGLYQAAKSSAKTYLAHALHLTQQQEIVRTAQEVLKETNQQNLQLLQQQLSTSQTKARQENASYLGRQWLQILPNQKPNQLADSETTEALRTRLLVFQQQHNTPCSYCGAFTNIGHEDVCKGATRKWIVRHNQVTRAFIKILSCRADLEVEGEPQANLDDNYNQPTQKRTDFSVLLGTSRYHYDVQIVAINKDSSSTDAHQTLTKAANEKKRKYSNLGGFFKPMIFSAGGLMEKETAQSYKGLQRLLGPTKAKWLDNTIAMILVQARVQAATSIAKP
jgi:hypothetical protein